MEMVKIAQVKYHCEVVLLSLLSAYFQSNSIYIQFTQLHVDESAIPIANENDLDAL